MKSFVLMNRKTADLFEAYRVTLMDKEDLELDNLKVGQTGYSITLSSHDGWVVYHPQTGVPFFLNLHSKKFFKNLGEL